VNEPRRTGAGPAGPAPVGWDADAEKLVAGIDAQIMVNWQALLLDLRGARCRAGTAGTRLSRQPRRG
jgi:hypothetical protein